MVQVAFSITRNECVQPLNQWCRTVGLTPDRRDRVVHEAPQRAEHRRKRGHIALETARRTDPEHRPHPQPEIEGTRMHEQALEDVLVPAHMEAPEPTRLVQMRTRSL